MRIALATSAPLPDGDPDDRHLAGVLGGEFAVWDDPRVDWDAYDLVVVRSTWDYPARREAFLGWAEALGERVRNAPEVLRWGTDKRYLAELAAAGLPVVPTRFDEPGAFDGPVVVKPAVGAGAQDAARHADPEAAAAHVGRLRASGRTAMVQPYVAGVEEAGETALIYLGGVYSHAVGKGAMLRADARTDPSGLYVSEQIAPREASGAEREVGDAVLAWLARRFGRLAYARVDLLPGPMILEVEVAEPSLYLGWAPGAAERLAADLVQAGAQRA